MIIKIGDFTVFEYIKEWFTRSKNERTIIRELRKIMAEQNESK